jgi:LPXTG-motif cell wall-anchored protein
MRRLAIVLSGLAAVFACLPAIPALAEYPTKVNTACHVETPGAVDGERVVLDVEVTANSSDRPTGTVELSISRGGGNAGRARSVQPAPVWTKTITYKGIPVRVTGPRLKPGRYLVHMQFRPSDDTFAGCQSMLSFRVAKGSVGSAVDGPSGGGDAVGGAGAAAGTGGSAGSGGGLPNTGGPHLGFLLLGAVLVALGGGAVARSRRTVTA